MHSNIVIIGSGFAAYQLIKSIRRNGGKESITVITADDGHDYNKPDLSHVFSKSQTASDLITLSADEFAKEYQVTMLSRHRVSIINKDLQTVSTESLDVSYDKLVLATGANTFVPPISGEASNQLITLNSLTEYQAFADKFTQAQQITLIGGGLIGVELALDLAKSGKSVTIVEPNSRLMQNLLPDYIELQLRKLLQQHVIEVITGCYITHIDNSETQQLLQLNNGKKLNTDETILATGLRSNIALAKSSGLDTNKGIIVDQYMQTSAHNIYAIGDCAEFAGEVRAFLQPIVVSAMALTKTLLGEQTAVTLPNSMIKVKTPEYPIQVAGITDEQKVASWLYETNADGIIAKAFDANEKFIGFVATHEKTKQAFSLLKQL